MFVLCYLLLIGTLTCNSFRIVQLPDHNYRQPYNYEYYPAPYQHNYYHHHQPQPLFTRTEAQPLFSLYYLINSLEMYRHPSPYHTKLDEVVEELCDDSLQYHLYELLHNVDGFNDVVGLTRYPQSRENSVWSMDRSFVNDNRQLIPVIHSTLGAINTEDRRLDPSTRERIVKLKQHAADLTLNTVQFREQALRELMDNYGTTEKPWTLTDVLEFIFGKQDNDVLTEMTENYIVEENPDDPIDDGNVEQFVVIIDDDDTNEDIDIRLTSLGDSKVSSKTDDVESLKEESNQNSVIHSTGLKITDSTTEVVEKEIHQSSWSDHTENVDQIENLLPNIKKDTIESTNNNNSDNYFKVTYYDGAVSKNSDDLLLTETQHATLDNHLDDNSVVHPTEDSNQKPVISGPSNEGNQGILLPLGKSEDLDIDLVEESGNIAEQEEEINVDFEDVDEVVIETVENDEMSNSETVTLRPIIEDLSEDENISKEPLKELTDSIEEISMLPVEDLENTVTTEVIEVFKTELPESNTQATLSSEDVPNISSDIEENMIIEEAPIEMNTISEGEEIALESSETTNESTVTVDNSVDLEPKVDPVNVEEEPNAPTTNSLEDILEISTLSQQPPKEANDEQAAENLDVLSIENDASNAESATENYSTQSVPLWISEGEITNDDQVGNSISDGDNSHEEKLESKEDPSSYKDFIQLLANEFAQLLHHLEKANGFQGIRENISDNDLLELASSFSEDNLRIMAANAEVSRAMVVPALQSLIRQKNIKDSDAIIEALEPWGREDAETDTVDDYFERTYGNASGRELPNEMESLHASLEEQSKQLDKQTESGNEPWVEIAETDVPESTTVKQQSSSAVDETTELTLETVNTFNEDSTIIEDELVEETTAVEPSSTEELRTDSPTDEAIETSTQEDESLNTPIEPSVESTAEASDDNIVTENEKDDNIQQPNVDQPVNVSDVETENPSMLDTTDSTVSDEALSFPEGSTDDVESLETDGSLALESSVTEEDATSSAELSSDADLAP